MDNEPSFSLRRLVHILFKRKLFIALFFVGTVAAAVVVSVKFLLPQYVATAQLMVSPTGDQGLDSAPLPLSGPTPPRDVGNPEARTARSIEILTGRTLSELVVKSIGADLLYPPAPPSFLEGLLGRFTGGISATHEEAAIDALRLHLQASVSGKSGWITLEFRHGNAEMAARVVNELANLYLERYVGMRRNERAEGFIQEQVTVHKDELDRASKELESFKALHQITSSAKDEQDLAMQQLGAARSEANEIGNREAELSSRIENLRGQVARARNDLAESSKGQAINKSATLSAAAMRERLGELEEKEAEMAERYTADYPPLKSVRTEIVRLRARLAKLDSDAKIDASAAPGDQATLLFLREELMRSESELSALKARRAAQTPQISTIQGKIATLDQIQGEYARLQQQVQVAQDNYRQYLASAEQARIGRAMDEERIGDLRVVEPARVPTRPEPSKAPQIVALAVFLGLFGGIGMALLLELAGDSLDSVEDVESQLSIPVLASVPILTAVGLPADTHGRAGRPVG